MIWGIPRQFEWFQPWYQPFLLLILASKLPLIFLLQLCFFFYQFLYIKYNNNNLKNCQKKIFKKLGWLQSRSHSDNLTQIFLWAIKNVKNKQNLKPYLNWFLCSLFWGSFFEGCTWVKFCTNLGEILEQNTNQKISGAKSVGIRVETIQTDVHILIHK